MRENIVAVMKEKKGITYPVNPPFHPPQQYPEYPFGNIEVDTSNHVYPLVRKLFVNLGADKENFGKENWNPLGELIKPRDKVLIKPNFVLHFNSSGEDILSVITHGSVLRAIIDYVYIALQCKGEVIIADAPQMNADFNKITEINGTKGVVKFYKRLETEDFKIKLLDLRQERTIYKYGLVWNRIKLKGDPEGYKIVDLKEDSEMKGIDSNRLYGADYNRKEIISAHSNGSNKYFISKTVLNADVVISVPKMKVHRKAGVTLNLKNMVGINGNKNYLAHYRIGPPEKGGDEFSRPYWVYGLDRRLKDLLLSANWRVGKYPFALWSFVKGMLLKFTKRDDVFICGDWYGNDTVWRMALDINKILLYADKEGMMKEDPQRRYFSVIDGIIAGEKEGPLGPSPKHCGLLIAGCDPVITDFVATKAMGFDYHKIPLIKNALKIKKYPLSKYNADDTVIKSNVPESELMFRFEPSAGWKGHIEL